MVTFVLSMMLQLQVFNHCIPNHSLADILQTTFQVLHVSSSSYFVSFLLISTCPSLITTLHHCRLFHFISTVFLVLAELVISMSCKVVSKVSVPFHILFSSCILRVFSAPITSDFASVMVTTLTSCWSFSWVTFDFALVTHPDSDFMLSGFLPVVPLLLLAYLFFAYPLFPSVNLHH
jgi:hypothetical protein